MTMSPSAVALYTFLLGGAISFVIAGMIKLGFGALHAAKARRAAQAEDSSTSVSPSP